MTRQEAIKEACMVFALAFHSIGKYDHPADGFCDTCPAGRDRGWNYQNSGRVFDYVRKAVLAQLKKDGHKVSAAFDAKTGKEKGS